jgi:hypothetical protein
MSSFIINGMGPRELGQKIQQIDAQLGAHWARLEDHGLELRLLRIRTDELAQFEAQLVQTAKYVLDRLDRIEEPNKTLMSKFIGAVDWAQRVEFLSASPSKALALLAALEALAKLIGPG